MLLVTLVLPNDQQKFDGQTSTHDARDATHCACEAPALLPLQYRTQHRGAMINRSASDLPFMNSACSMYANLLPGVNLTALTAVSGSRACDLRCNDTLPEALKNPGLLTCRACSEMYTFCSPSAL